MQRYNYFDIHSHNSGTYDDVLTIQNVRQGVEMIDNSIGYYSIGVHPYDVEKVNVNDLKFDLNDKKLVAIGEIGLDLRPQYANKRQVNIFEKQVEIAVNKNLPIIIHCVKAFPETIKILDAFNATQVIFHGFNNSAKIAEKILSKNYAISLGAKLLQNRPLQELSKEVVQSNEKQIFFETDDTKADIREIYNVAAQIAKIELHKLQDIIKSNIGNYFGKIELESTDRVDVER